MIMKKLKVYKSNYKAKEEMPKFVTFQDIVGWWTRFGEGHFNYEHYLKVINARK